MLEIGFIVLVAVLSLGGWWLVRQANTPPSATGTAGSVRASGQPTPGAGQRHSVISRIPWPLLMAVGLGLTILGYATGSMSYVGGLVGLGFALFLAGMVRPLLRSERGDAPDQ